MRKFTSAVVSLWLVAVVVRVVLGLLLGWGI